MKTITHRSHSIRSVVIQFYFMVSILLVGCANLSIQPVDTKTPKPRLMLPTLTSTQTPSPTYTPSPSNTPTSTITPSPTVTPSLTPTPTPLGGSGLFLFDGYIRKAGNFEPLGISLVNIETMEQIPVGNENFELNDVSPDGQYILASQEKKLFVLHSNGEIKTKLSENLLNQLAMDAYWHSTNQIIFIGKEGGQPYVYLTNPNGTDLFKLTETGKNPFMLYPSYDGDYVYWEEGYETTTGEYHLGTWRSNMDGSEHTQSDLYDGISLSGKHIAYSVDPSIDTIGGDVIYIANSDGTNEREIMELKEPLFVGGLFWSTDEEKLLVQVVECDPKCDNYSHYLISIDEKMIAELPSEIERIFHTGVWSADSQLFLYKKVFKTETGASMGLAILNLDTMDINTLELSLPENFWIGNLLWVPIGTNK